MTQQEIEEITLLIPGIRELRESTEKLQESGVLLQASLEKLTSLINSGY